MKRVLLTLLWVLTATVICSAQTIYFPHVSNGVQGSVVWKTTIFLTNPGSANAGTASGSVTFTQENPTLNLAGSAFNVTFVDETGSSVSVGNTIPFQLAPGQTRKFVSNGAGGITSGFATVSSNIAVNGTAIFSEFDSSGRLIGEAGVPAGAAVPRQAIFVDTLAGYNLAVAYVNPGSSAVNVQLSLVNAAGVALSPTPLTQTLGAGNHKAAFTSELFPGSPQMAGTMQITSGSPISAIALRFDPTFAVFTTLPPVTLASLLNPAVQWLEQRPWLAPLTSFAKLLGGLQFNLG